MSAFGPFRPRRPSTFESVIGGIAVTRTSINAVWPIGRPANWRKGSKIRFRNYFETPHVPVVCALLASGTANAATMVETSSIETGSVALNTVLSSQDFPQFNPANGTLTSVQETLTGTATWTSSGAPFLSTLLGPSDIASQGFTGADTITFNMSGMSSSSATLTDFTGTGSTSVELALFVNSTGAGTFATNGTGLLDTITYTFTPTATPLPAALPLFATGLGAMGLFGWRRKRKAQAVAA
jgi:hypothetical protein